MNAALLQAHCNDQRLHAVPAAAAALAVAVREAQAIPEAHSTEADMHLHYHPAAKQALSQGRGFVKAGANTVRRKIRAALDNPAYRSRTLQGIAGETRLPPELVLKAIQQDRQLAAQVKVIPILAQDGSVLITTKSRFAREASFKEKFVDFFASHRQELADVK